MIDASWSGSPKKRTPRPLHVKTRAPSAETSVMQLAEVLVGRDRVADLELDGGAHVDHVADGHGAHLAVDADDVPDDEVASLEVGSRLVDRAAEVQTVRGQRHLLGRKRVKALHQPIEGPLATDLVEDVALGLRHDERRADRPAALRHDACRPVRPDRR